MSDAMVVNHGKGKELCDLLRKELSIPPLVISFSVKFERNETVKVVCEYMPLEPEAAE